MIVFFCEYGLLDLPITRSPHTHSRFLYVWDLLLYCDGVKRRVSRAQTARNMRCSDNVNAMSHYHVSRLSLSHARMSETCWLTIVLTDGGVADDQTMTSKYLKRYLLNSARPLRMIGA